MPSPDQIIHGKPRRAWLLDAAKALIASMDEAHLYHMVKIADFDAFYNRARPAFKETEPGIAFTRSELRWVWNYLENHIDIEVELQAMRARDREKKKDAKGGPVSVAVGGAPADAPSTLIDTDGPLILMPDQAGVH